MKTIGEIFNDFLNKKSNIFKIAINFSIGKQNSVNPGDQFESNIKKIFDDNNISYEWQPNGSQQFPDFYLPNYDVCINLECKTSKSGRIVWNSGFPHSNMILLYACSKLNDITFLKGERIVDEKTSRQKIKEWAREWNKKLCNEFNELFKLDNWDFYLREMYNDKNNYLRNSNRTNYEKEVIEYLSKRKSKAITKKS